MNRYLNPKGSRKVSLFRRHENMPIIIMFVGFVAAIIIMQLIAGASSGTIGYPSFISPVNLFNIMMQIACVGIMAVGMTMVMISGGIDLSVGFLVSLIAIFTATAITKWGMSVPVAITLALFLSIGLEAILGFIISRSSAEPFIITLGGMIAFQGIALLLCKSHEVTMQGQLDFFKTNLLNDVKSSEGLIMSIPIYVVIFIAVTVIIWWLLKYTKYGRRIYAVGANSNAAYLSGIDVKNIKLSTYMLNGLLVGGAAILLLARVNVGIITLGQGLEIDTIAAVVIGGVAMSGGKGNIWGTFLGAVLLGTIANAMNILRLQSEWQFVAKGVIIIVAVYAGAISAQLSARNDLRRKHSLSEES